MRLRLFLILFSLSFVCHSSEESSCTSDLVCPIYNTCTDEKCVRKDLFPMASAEIGGTFLLVSMAIISISGGIGGSAICSAFLLSLFQFLPHQAVALTQSFLLSGTITAVALKIMDRHPTKDRPIIYYDFLLQLTCPLVLGVSIGILVNPAFPGWLILALLTIVIIVVLALTFRSGLIIFKQEQSRRKLKIMMDDKGEGAGQEDDHENIIKTEKDFINKDENENKDINGLTEQQESQSISKSKNDEEENEEINEKQNKIDKNCAGTVLNNNEEAKIMRNDSSVKLKKGSKKVLSEEEYLKYANLPEELRKSIKNIRVDEKKPISFIHILFFVLMTGFGICFTIFRGTQNSDSVIGVEKCSGGFYGLLLTYIIIMISLSI